MPQTDRTGDPLGRLDTRGDRFELRYERLLPHSCERVWQAITDPGDLAGWFPAAIHGGWAPGARLTFVFDGDEGPTMEGVVREAEPPRLLELTWGDEVLRFELEPAQHGCRFVFVNTFLDGTKAARDGAGWHDCLQRLAAGLEGRSVSFDRAGWEATYERYAEALGPEHSGAPIPPAPPPADPQDGVGARS